MTREGVGQGNKTEKPGGQEAEQRDSERKQGAGSKTEVEKEALGQKDRKIKETGREMGDGGGWGQGAGHRLSEEDREQDKVIQGERKGTGRQDKVEDRQKEETGSRTEMEEKKPRMGSRTDSWRREKSTELQDRDGLRKHSDREKDRVTENKKKNKEGTRQRMGGKARRRTEKQKESERDREQDREMEQERKKGREAEPRERETRTGSRTKGRKRKKK